MIFEGVCVKKAVARSLGRYLRRRQKTFRDCKPPPGRHRNWTCIQVGKKQVSRKIATLDEGPASSIFFEVQLRSQNDNEKKKKRVDHEDLVPKNALAVMVCELPRNSHHPQTGFNSMQAPKSSLAKKADPYPQGRDDLNKITMACAGDVPPDSGHDSPAGQASRLILLSPNVPLLP